MAKVLRPFRRDVGERALIEQRRIHRPSLGQVFDHHGDELDLRGGCRLVAQELAERLGDRMAIQTDERADRGADRFSQNLTDALYDRLLDE